jgi:hypothetical protein
MTTVQTTVQTTHHNVLHSQIMYDGNVCSRAVIVVLDANRWHASARSCIAWNMSVNSAGCEFIITYRLKYNFVIKQHAERLTDTCFCGSKI